VCVKAKKGAGGGKRSRKGREKQKANQDMTEITKLIKEKRTDADEIIGTAVAGGKKKTKKKAKEGDEAE
jgi:hypothetical protein